MGLGVTKSEFALLISIRSFAGILSPIFSPLSERYGRRPILIFSMLLFSVGCGIVIFLPTYWPLGVALSAIAVAKVVYDPAMQAFLGDTVPYQQRGRAVSITELSWAGSFLLAIPAIGFIMDNQGWRAPFLWLGAFGALSAFMLWRALPSPAADGRSGQVTNLRATIHIILRQPVIWAAGIYIMMVMGANELILIIYGGWMKSSFDLSLINLGLATGIIGAAEIAGEVTVGVAVDRLGKRPVVITTGLLACQPDGRVIVPLYPFPVL
jgi:predicted MFS family arabinose efflux permease